MRNICIQSGHWNTKNGQTGAPREQERTIAIGKRLTELLNQNGFYALQTDALADQNKDITGKDWDLFLALHCDANYAGDEGGGFVDWIDPSIDSSAESNKESERVAKAIETIYFAESGVRNMPNRRNPNTKFYYMWSALSENTHCVIIEMGESIDPHDNVILNDTERQCQILLKSIKNAYPDVQPPQPAIDWKAEYDKKIKEIDQIKTQCALDVKAATENKNTLAGLLRDCEIQRDTYKGEYDKANASDGYKVQIQHLEQYKNDVQKELSEAQRLSSYWQTKYKAIKKSGLKFIQHAIILLCEKAGINLSEI